MDGNHLPDYISLAEIAVVGFIVIRILAHLGYRILIDISKRQASTSQSIITISGYLTVVSIIVATLAKGPPITVDISTITRIVLGISPQILIGNAIAGMVLAISRPFRIRDTIKVFDNTGIIEDIGPLHTRIMTADGDMIIAPYTTLLSSAVLKLKVERRDNKTGTAEVA